MRAQIISQARNDVTLSGGQRAQAGLRHFLRGLRTANEFLLACDRVELRNSGARAERANADAIRFHFLGETFCEEQVEGFGRSVRAKVGNTLERSSGG